MESSLDSCVSNSIWILGFSNCRFSLARFQLRNHAFLRQAPLDDIWGFDQSLSARMGGNILFAPTVVALLTGQIGPLILLGVVGFLHFEMREQYGLAGASLVLVAIKPHLVYLLWPTLLLWAIERRRWDAILGLCLGLFSVSMVVLLLDPAVFSEYGLLNLTAPHPTPFDQETPTLGRALKNLVMPESHLSQFFAFFAGHALAAILLENL